VPVSISGVTSYLPPTLISDQNVEERITAASPGYTPRPGVIGRLTGIGARHLAAVEEDASDLAVSAAAKLLCGLGLEPDQLDLVVFASASQDVLEPATAHIVAAKLGATCPVFDVKNACNSFLNGIEVAEALIASGRYRRVLVCSGEKGSRAVRWSVADRAQFMDSLAGYTLSDAGGAVLLEPSESQGILYRSFSADSSAWDVSSVPGHGAANPRDLHRDGYIQGDGRHLTNSVLGAGIRWRFDAALEASGLSREDFAVFCVHQVAAPHLRVFRNVMDIPEDKLVVTVTEHGNVASCSLPLQLSLAIESGRCVPGDKVALIGLAGGISIGIMFVEL
jgi:acyl-CoA:acyl-CoA alkyltransferase